VTHEARMPGLTAHLALQATAGTYRSSMDGGRQLGQRLTTQAGFGVPRGQPECIPDWMCKCVTPGRGCPCCQDDVPNPPVFLPPRR